MNIAKNPLKKYLILRRLWLHGAECKTLFPSDIDYNTIHERFVAIHLQLPAVRTRKLRKLYNEVVLIKSGGDLILTSKVMGHKIRTNNHHYNDPPQELVDQQIGGGVHWKYDFDIQGRKRN